MLRIVRHTKRFQALSPAAHKETAMYWEELSGDTFPQAVENAGGVCLLPLSCIERHGHHLPLGTDRMIGHELCRRVAALEPVVIFPDLIFTQIAEARHCPGTISIDPELTISLLDNACDEIARNGLDKIVLISTHGGNRNFARYFAQTQLSRRRDHVVYFADPPLLPADDSVLADQWKTAVDGHAGEKETAQVLAIRPDTVDMETATGTEGMPLGRLQGLADRGVYTGGWWYANHPTHYRGDGRPATAEQGDRLLAARARALAEAIRWIKEDRAAATLQAEFFDAAEQHTR
jgi:creatinine amidohydrolase